jgi:uncharacterized protein
MGHRDSSQEFGGQGAVCGDCGGFGAAAEEAVSEMGRGERAADVAVQKAGHRLKPVLQKSWGARAALLALNFYKVYLSPWLAGSCRYEPTCSRYAYEAIERFGVARGMWLGTKRLLRCHPFTRKFGYDPVPEKWEEMRSDTWEKNLESDRSKDRALHGGVRW